MGGCSAAPAAAPSGAGGASEPAPLVTPQPSRSEAAGGGTLRWSIGEPSAIVPHAVTDQPGKLVVDVLFDSLTGYGKDLEIVPSAASSWRSNRDATVWTFRLRPDATFHDGSPVTAGAFKHAWELAVKRDLVGFHLRDVAGYAGLRRGDAAGLSGVRVVDDQALEVTLSRPRADFAAVVAHPALGPVAWDAWSADEAGYRRRPIGNGPFAMAEAWAEGQFVRVSRFEDWDNAGPRQVPPVDGRVDEVLFRITDPDTAYVAFQQGRADITQVPQGALSQAIEAYGRSSPGGYEGPGLLQGAEATLYYLGVNTTKPPFNRVDVRRALSFAIDRTAITDGVLEGNAAPARSAIPPALPSARSRVCGTCLHVPSAAAALFAEHDVSELTLWYNADGGHEPVVEMIRANLAEVGVRLEVRETALPNYLAALQTGDAVLYPFGWTAEHPTAGDFMWPLFHSSQVPTFPGDGANYGRYANPEVDDLLERASATRDATTRTNLYQQAEDIAVGQDQAIVPIMTYRHRLVVAERVEGFVFNGMGSANLETVTLDEDAPPAS